MTNELIETPEERGLRGLEDVRRIEAAGWPADLPASTYEMIARTARRCPRAKAISFFLTAADHRRPEVWTYGRLLRRITQTANLFTELGIGKDDVVAYVLPNLPETHFTIWGGEAAGIVCAINPMLSGAAIADLLNASGAKVLVTLAPFPGTDLYAKLQGVLGGVPGLRHMVLVDMADRLRGAERVTAKRKADRWLPIPASIRIHDFRRATLAQPHDQLVSGRRIDRQDVSSMFCTGGTTGTPKLAIRRHANEIANAWMIARGLGKGLGPNTVVLSGLPLFHVNAVLVTGLGSFARGAHVVIATSQGYRAQGLIPRFWEIIEHHRINLFSGVPTVFASLLQVPLGDHDVSSLEFALCGAAPMPLEVLKAFQERTGMKILEGYGLTESTCVSSMNPPGGERRIGSIGVRLPFQQMRIVILDETGAYVREADVEEAGVVALAGPNIFAGYRADAHNDGIWLDLGDGQCWFNTGDLGRLDADGYVWLVGRRKELIIRGGHNIDPAIIEEQLHRHPAVELAAAIGRPDAHAGEVPVAYVQLRRGAKVEEAELMAYVRGEISERAAAPKAVRIIAEMPLTAVGKLFKPKLKWMETEHALTEALTEAGVKAQVTVVEDREHGSLAGVSLLDPALADVARTVLGRFTVATKIRA